MFQVDEAVPAVPVLPAEMAEDLVQEENEAIGMLVLPAENDLQRTGDRKRHKRSLMLRWRIIGEPVRKIMAPPLRLLLLPLRLLSRTT